MTNESTGSEYPTAWGFQPDREEPPTVADRPITSLRFGAYTEPRERGDEYPAEWDR